MYSTKTVLVSLLLVMVIGLSIMFGVYITYNHFTGDVGASDNSQGDQQKPEEENKEEEKEEVEIPTENSLFLGNTGLALYSVLPDIDPITIDNDTVLFSDETVWKPGHAEVIYLAVAHDNTVTVSYSVGVKFTDNAPAKNAAGEEVKLSELLMFGVINNPGEPYTTAADAIAAVNMSKPVSQNFSRVGAVEPDSADFLAIVVYLPESAGELTGGEIDLGLTVYATSVLGGEEEELVPEPPNTFTESVEAPSVDESGATTAPVTIGGGSKNSAVLPEGVKLNEGAESLLLTVQTIETPNGDVPVNEGETARAIDVHIEGVAEDNTVPMIVTLNRLLPKGLNTTSVRIYHVENGTPVEMTLVDNPVNHNEFSYNPANGNVVMAVASFSEYVPVTDDKNNWEGGFDYSWYTGKTSPYTISSADQLAAFGKIVDGTADNIAADSFAGKVVNLGANIDLSGGVSLNPIGCGYVNGTSNSGGAEGRSFEGTFDGQGYTISNLNQNGWDLGLSYCNLGGGLFASVHNATIQNLTMNNANIVMECVEQGVVAGLAQGNCKFININIVNCSVANYQKATGGVVGEVSWGAADAAVCTHEFTNISIDAQTVVGSLWGDFDAPVGGVIGARWDDNDGTAVKMTDVTVACRLDVYNDVTSSYQWYAYRRAGMLIGNTEKTAAREDGATVAAAPFLSCENVVVKYGDWTNYHYCEFNNHNSSWPFVRVEAGENCTAFSNPRWGVPNDINGVKVTPEHHPGQDTSIHQAGDTCYELIKFGQLYGGGQGVYGQTEHSGVTVQDYYYEITYKYGTETYKTEKITTFGDYTIDHTDYPARDGHEFKAWVNAGGNAVIKINAGNTTDVVLYDSWKTIYTARFVDQNGNVIYEEEFTEGQASLFSVPAVPAVEGGYTGVWSEYDLKNATGDITIYPVYNAEDGIVSLTPVDTDGDGVTDVYHVTNVKEDDSNINIVIPDSLNGIPVVEVSDGAFSEFDNITTVRIPVSITSIGADAFANKEGFVLKYEQITFLYEGTYEQWLAIEKDANWDRYVGEGSRIYFLADGTYSEETARNGIFSATNRVWSAPVAGTYNP